MKSVCTNLTWRLNTGVIFISMLNTHVYFHPHHGIKSIFRNTALYGQSFTYSSRIQILLVRPVNKRKIEEIDYRIIGALKACPLVIW